MDWLMMLLFGMIDDDGGGEEIVYALWKAPYAQERAHQSSKG
jgi:hypothetical protein